MATNAKRINQLVKEDPALVAKAFHATLKDFGYTSLTLDYVKEELGRLVSGEAPSGIIGKFMQGWLENGLDSNG